LRVGTGFIDIVILGCEATGNLAGSILIGAWLARCLSRRATLWNDVASICL